MSTKGAHSVDVLHESVYTCEVAWEVHPECMYILLCDLRRNYYFLQQKNPWLTVYVRVCGLFLCIKMLYITDGFTVVVTELACYSTSEQGHTCL